MNALNTKHTLSAYEALLKKHYLLVESRLDNMDFYIDLLTYNSKEAVQNTLFICKGAAFKEAYLKEAISKGAAAYVSEKRYRCAGDTPCLIVSDIRKSMSLLANLFYNYPWKKLKVIGIGGTKGKSTTAYYCKFIIDEYMEAFNKPKCAIISSIDTYDGVIMKESHITTPESVELHAHFNNALNSGIEYLVMEVSSQALKYNRVDNVRFDVGAFLNISEDHISPIEHSDFDDYFGSKLKMFSLTDKAIINLDIDCKNQVLSSGKDAKSFVTVSTKDSSADFYAYNISKESGRITFKVRCDDFDADFSICMPGLFNVSNALCAIVGAHLLKIPLPYIVSGLAKATSSGRMELYSSKNNNIIAIVDYAHNKLSFEALFSSMKIEFPNYDIISLFGCPGKKAYQRREDLGLIAGEYSKKVFLCAEDPGAEPVNEISNDIAKYVAKQNCPYEMIEDRGEAIKAAFNEANEAVDKTLLLITGKGNETRQKYGSEYIDCISDVEYVKKYLAEYDDTRL